MFNLLHTKFTNWVAALTAVLSFCFIVVPFGDKLPEERKCVPEFNGTFLQSWLSSSWDEERWADEVETMEKDGVKYLVLQDLATMDLEGNWNVYYDTEVEALKDAAFGGDVLKAALEAVNGSDIQIFVGLTSFDNLWSTGTLTKEYTMVCDVTADMIEDIHSRYYEGNEANFYSWYFTMEFSNNILMQLGMPNIIRGLNTVLDKATETNSEIPMMMSPFTSNYLALGKGTALMQWMKLLSSCHWRDGDIFAPQDAVGAAWIEEDDLVTIWKMYALAVEQCRADVKLWANCENFTSAIADTFGAGFINPPASENIVNVPATLDRFTYQMDVASRYCENIITFSYSHYYSENERSDAFIRTYRDYVDNGYVLEREAPVMGSFTKTATDEGIELQWEQASDNIGISHYRLMKNGKFLHRAETFDGYHRVSYTDEGGTIGDRYTIVAFDAAGNISQEIEAK